jgi:hypothetical protein
MIQQGSCQPTTVITVGSYPFCCCFVALLQIGQRHEFSAGLLIGGKAVAEEASRVNAMNILVATPGEFLGALD